MNSSRSDHERDRPPGQQLEVPRDDHPGDHQQPVDDRIEQRPRRLYWPVSRAVKPSR